MAENIDDVFRDWNVQGDPASGEYEPEKPRIRALLWQMQATSGQSVTRNTLVQLNAVTPPDENYGGIVLNDPDPANNGYYARVSGAWVRGRGFPDTFAEGVLSGSGTAQVAAFGAGVNPADIEIFWSRVATENTGPMTLNGKPVVSVAGNPLVPGEWTGVVLYVDEGPNWRLLIDVNAAQIASQAASDAAIDAGRAEDAADRAEAAAIGVEFPVSYAPQTLTPEQQAQARANIGVVAFRSFAEFSADTSLSYTNDPRVSVGQSFLVQEFQMEFVAEDATEFHWQTAGGVKAVVSVHNVLVNQYVFGAQGGMADDTAAIKAMLKFSEDTGVYPWATSGEHVVSDLIVINVDCNLLAMTLYADATTLPKVVRVGPDAHVAPFNDLWMKTIHLPSVINSAKTGTGWAGFEDSVGIEIANALRCDIYHRLSQGFGVGLDLGGYSRGTAQNTINFGLCYDNLKNVRLKAKNASGWTNDNLFIGGQCAYSGVEGTEVAGTRHISFEEFSAAAEYAAPNNNVFQKTSLEGNAPEFQVWCQGTYNSLENCRWESSAVFPKVRFYGRTGTQTRNNYVIGGYGANLIVFSYDGPGLSGFNGMLSPTRISVTGSGAKAAIALGNSSGAGSGNPHITGFAPGTTDPLLSDGTETNWGYKLFAQGLYGKSFGDANPRLGMSFNDGRFYFGSGASPFTVFLNSSGTTLWNNGSFAAWATNTFDLGTSGVTWRNIYSQNAVTVVSDAREKLWLGAFEEREKRVARALLDLLGFYKWDANVVPGADDLKRVGVTAQSVMGVFGDEGLIPEQYAIVQHHEWGADDERGADAGDRYTLQPDQLWGFMFAGVMEIISEMREDIHVLADRVGRIEETIH